MCTLGVTTPTCLVAAVPLFIRVSDSGYMPFEHMNDSAVTACRSESSSIPPADFRFYNVTGKIMLGNQYVPLCLSASRTPRGGASRREVKPNMQTRNIR